VRGRTERRVPWSEVEDFGATVKLRGRAVDLGLAHEDRDLQLPIRHLPGRRSDRAAQLEATSSQ
jgi:hypothetical protein